MGGPAFWPFPLPHTCCCCNLPLELNADFTITVSKNKKFLSAIIRDETQNCSIVTKVPRLTAYNSFVWLVITSLIWNRSPRSSFLHDPQCVTFPHEKSQSICVSVVAELFNGVRITRQGKQSLNLASAAECIDLFPIRWELVKAQLFFC